MKMKRVLSLLLALVMTMSLLTLPSYAEDEAALSDMTVAEQYDALMGMDEAAAQAAFSALTEAQQTALENYAAEVNGADTTPVQELNVVSSSVVAPLVKVDVEPAMPAKKAPMKAPLKVSGTPAPDSTSNKETDAGHEGLFLNKNVTKNTDDTYTLRLESYVTGNVTISTETTTLPSDIVLVLDVSGSMDDYINIGGGKKDTSVLDTARGNDGYYKYHTSYGWHNVRYRNGKWQYQLGSTGLILIWNDISGGWGNDDECYFGITKMDALKAATKNFVNQVQEQSVKDGVDHKISIVTYSGSSTVVQQLTSVTSTTNANAVKTKIDGLNGNGATRADLGMGNAMNIINGISRDSNKVVIMFTDGVPTSGNTFEDTVANATIANSKAIKDKGAWVYTIGVLDGADDRVPMSEDASNVNKYIVNKYMHYVSSNFKNASDMDHGGTPTYPGGNQSYYLAASNADRISGIFQEISEQIATGGASRVLGTSTVVKDVVTKGFDLPDNTSDIKVYTAPYQGYTDVSKTTRKFGTPVEYKSADVKIDGQTVTVKNFDYSSDANCVTDTTENNKTTYSGNKLIVEFKITRDKDFLGGNQVPTNENTSGVYENDTATTPVGTFVVPKTNVDIPKVTVTAKDKNVYLMGSLTKDDLMDGVIVMCGNVDITDPSTLQDWQTAYVNIENAADERNNLTTDKTYTVTATVSPKTDGTAETKSDSDEANVNVFKPEVTFEDSTVYYGDNAPKSYDNNLVSTVWKHDGTEAVPANMTGTAPVLTWTYGVEDNIIKTTEDIPVSVTAKILGIDVDPDDVSFVHKKCDGKTCSVPDGKQFLLHVNTCTLTIKKNGWDPKDENQSFLFDVNSVGNIPQSMQVTVQMGKNDNSVTIVGLPTGTYTVTENQDWSWRYELVSVSADSVTLGSANQNATVTITNKRANDKWLSGENYAINHVGGIKASGTFVSGN